MIDVKTLKTCPLCGSNAEVKCERCSYSDEEAYFVQCCNDKCRTSTTHITAGYHKKFNGKSDIEITPIMAKNKAIRNWNIRVGDDVPHPWEKVATPVKVMRKRVHNDRD